MLVDQRRRIREVAPAVAPAEGNDRRRSENEAVKQGYRFNYFLRCFAEDKKLVCIGACLAIQIKLIDPTIISENMLKSGF